MKKTKLLSISIKELKNLKNLDITFDRPLTAIMGTNGSGKSTILHALACCFSPETPFATNLKFSYFFPPNPNASWINSCFELSYTSDLDKYERGITKAEHRVYHKDFDRWAPRYANRPTRDCRYIGVNTCLPDIETVATASRISYTTNVLNDKTSKKVADNAGIILNKDYDHLTINESNNKKFAGVQTKSNLSYSSLSMGAGEQRILKILNTIFSAPAYSLILIDEIDLLLHSSALMELIRTLYDCALQKHLQVIFTTHSLLMDQLKDYVDIRFLDNTPSKTLVYDHISSESYSIMTGLAHKPLKIYVEDILSETIIKHLTISMNMIGKVNIKRFGSIENAFTLAAGLILKNEPLENTLIVLDGDRYILNDEKADRIKKVLSGTEADIEEKRNNALSIITQYCLPYPESSPEYNLYQMINELATDNNTCEIIKYAKHIRAVNDSHNWISTIANQLDNSSEIITYEIIKTASKSEKWESYVQPIKEWLSEHSAL